MRNSISDLDMSTLSSNVSSALEMRVAACGAGYTGTRLQSRSLQSSGSYSAWTDIDTSACVCSPTFENQTLTCDSPQSGTHDQQRDWACTAGVGSWNAWYDTANNCYTPCAVSPSETRSSACASGFTGTVNEARDSSCPGGVGSNSSSVWSAWYETSDNCVPITITTDLSIGNGGSESFWGLNAYRLWFYNSGANVVGDATNQLVTITITNPPGTPTTASIPGMGYNGCTQNMEYTEQSPTRTVMKLNMLSCAYLYLDYGVQNPGDWDASTMLNVKIEGQYVIDSDPSNNEYNLPILP